MKFKFFISVLIVITFASCQKLIDKEISNHYYYNWNKSKIIYHDHRTWNFSTEVNCDLESFKVINGPWAKDKNSVFYDGKAKLNIDVATFYFDKNGLPKDKEYVFTVDRDRNTDRMLVWKGADPKTFELISVKDPYKQNLWGKDDKNYFWMLRPVDCDYANFEILDLSYSKDKDNVYYERNIVTDADPNTFKFDSLKYIYKDKNFEYNRGEKK